MYRFQARYQASGRVIPSMAVPGQVVLAYPVLEPGTRNHVILSSPDGTRWTAIRGTDSHAQQLVEVNTSTFGFFAVAQSGVVGPSGGSRAGQVAQWVLAAGIPLLVVVLLARAELRRRARERAGSPAKGRPKRSRPR